jgi:hypothetical protein
VHYVWYQNETYLVLADPVLTPPAGSVSLELGGILSLSLALSGGLPPYAIAWQGLPPGCSTINGTTLACRPTGAGPFTVVVTLVDGTGFREYVPISVSVDTPGTVPQAPWEEVGLAFVGAGLLVMITACALLLLRRRGRP